MFFEKGISIAVDRPKGFVKEFPTPTGPVKKTYPVDYGYAMGIINPDDGEPLDIFVGTGKLCGRFMKGQNLDGTWKPDERKWFVRLTPEELEAVKDLFESQSAGLLRDVVVFDSEDELVAEVLSVQALA